MFVVVALWGVPALIRTHGQFLAIGLGQHVVGRSFGTMQGHGGTSILSALGSLPYYFLTVFVTFAPWSWKIPGLVRAKWKERDLLDLYLLVGVLLTVAIFTLVKTKLPHYILPAFPLLALLISRHWIESGVHERVLRCWAGATAAVMLLVALVGFPFMARYFPAAVLFKEAESYLQPKMDFAAYDFDAPSLVWVFRGRVHGFLAYNRENSRDVATLQPDQIRPFLASAGPHFVVLPSKVADRLYPVLPDGYRKFSTHGFDIAKGRWVDLTLVLKNT